MKVLTNRKSDDSLNTESKKSLISLTPKQIEILDAMTVIYAQGGADTTSMRSLAKQVGVAASVLYHYFPDKESLLQAMYHYNNKVLGELRADLPTQKTPEQKLAQIIAFQFDHAARVVAVLKYYFSHRNEFKEQGFAALPPKATLHVEEVLQEAVDQGLYRSESLRFAKVIAHSINGYLLEYFPFQPTKEERAQLTNDMVSFISLALGSNTNIHSHSLLGSTK